MRPGASPGAIADELRAAGGDATDLSAFLETLGPAARGALEVVLDVDGRTEAGLLPAGLPDAIAKAAAGALAELLASLRRDAERLAHPRRDFSGVPQEVGRELLDGLAGLLLNRLSLERAPRPEEIEARLGPAGGLPTRARHARSVAISGAPFADALGRFFAARSTALALPRTGRSVLVWRSGSCPFAVAGWSEATPHG